MKISGKFSPFWAGEKHTNKMNRRSVIVRIVPIVQTNEPANGNRKAGKYNNLLKQPEITRLVQTTARECALNLHSRSTLWIYS